jgi:hypothetical protein
MAAEKRKAPESHQAFATSALRANAAPNPQGDDPPVEPGYYRDVQLGRLPVYFPSYDSEHDHRKPWTRYPMGYPRFAAFIANDEDRSTTIFRRFQRLSSRNLLYLESELAYLEAEQDRLDQESRKSHELTMCMKSWKLLCLQATPPREEPKGENAEDKKRRLELEAAARERLQLAWRIREVLATYREQAATWSPWHRELIPERWRRVLKTRERSFGVECPR